MKRHIIILSLFLIASLPALQAADTLTVEQKKMLFYRPAVHFRGAVWLNPAIRFDASDFSLTSVSVDGSYERRGNASLVQEGTGYRDFAFRVESFVKLSERDKVFGHASYRNSRREEVRWNENADFDLIYPYVTGDSIGGFMKGEQYRFMGGYAHRFGTWTIGGQFDYHASITYRDQDPRPRNVTSNIQASFALSRKLSHHYTLGLAFNVRKYSQKSDISFLADKGSTSVYHMLGLGVDYVRFAGTQTSSNYGGSGFGGSIDILPQTGNGLSASINTSYFQFSKELPNSNNAPISKMKETKFGLDVAWLQHSEIWEYGAKLSAVIAKRDGIENIFGDPTGNVYPIISSVSQFKNTMIQADLSGVIGQNVIGERHWGWMLTPVAGYWKIKPEYKGANRWVDISALRAGMEVQSIWKFSRLLLTASTSVGYTANMKSEYSLPELNMKSSVGKALLSNVDYLSDDHVSMLLSLRGDYKVSDKYIVFISGQWLHQDYKVSGITNLGEASIGFVF